MEKLKINSVYVPETCLQGDKFPAHITWTKTEKIEVTVEYSAPLKIKHVYNVPKEGIKQTKDNRVIIKKFDVNGYVGFVFNSSIIDQVKVKPNIQFTIKNVKNSGLEKYSKDIILFRPSIEILKIPEKIKVNYDSEEESYSLDNKILLKNTGDGTAIIGVDVVSEKVFERSVHNRMDKFVDAVYEDLSEKFDELKEVFPEYNSLLGQYIKITKPPINLNDEFRDKYKKIEEDFFEAFEDNEDFYEQFIHAVSTSYLRNIHLITETKSFLNYLNSIGEGKVILLNYLDVINSQKTSGKLELNLYIKDLANNEHPSITLQPIQLELSQKCQIPIHILFDWKVSNPRRMK